MKVPTNDGERLQRFLELMPESFVEDFANYHLYNGFFPYGYTNVLDKYNSAKGEVMLEFLDGETKRKYQEFNKEFDVLQEFLFQHFSVPSMHYKVYKDPPFLYLEPRYHHNFRSSESGGFDDPDQDSQEWQRLLSELHERRESFYHAYRGLLRTASKSIVGHKSWIRISLAWLGKHLVGVFFAVAAAGIIFLLKWN